MKITTLAAAAAFGAMALTATLTVSPAAAHADCNNTTDDGLFASCFQGYAQAQRDIGETYTSDDYDSPQSIWDRVKAAGEGVKNCMDCSLDYLDRSLQSFTTSGDAVR